MLLQQHNIYFLFKSIRLASCIYAISKWRKKNTYTRVYCYARKQIRETVCEWVCVRELNVEWMNKKSKRSNMNLNIKLDKLAALIVVAADIVCYTTYFEIECLSAWFLVSLSSVCVCVFYSFHNIRFKCLLFCRRIPLTCVAYYTWILLQNEYWTVVSLTDNLFAFVFARYYCDNITIPLIVFQLLRPVSDYCVLFHKMY